MAGTLEDIKTTPNAPGGATEPSAASAPLFNLSHHDTGKVGMIAFLVTEVAFFSTLIITYITYLGQSRVGPYPIQVFDMKWVLLSTACLLSSSVTIHFADAAWKQGLIPLFRRWWMATMALGLLFLAGTAYEWYDLIYHWRLTISRNLFGTTYFTLVGFHAFHVTVGLTLMAMVLGLAFGMPNHKRWPLNVELVSWYWHFVDAVWVVVFTLVYVIGR